MRTTLNATLAITLALTTHSAIAAPLDMRAQNDTVPVCATREAAQIAQLSYNIDATEVLSTLIDERYCIFVDPAVTISVDDPAAHLSSGVLGDENIAVFVFPDFLEPLDDTIGLPRKHVLTHDTYMCREAIMADLYQSRVDVGDTAGAHAIIQENGCLLVPAGETVQLSEYVPSEHDDILVSSRPVYAARAPLGDHQLPGFIPQAQIQ